MVNDELNGKTHIFYSERDISKESIFTRLQKLRDKHGEEWFDTPMLPEDCVRIFGYERDILFLTHIADTLMKDERLNHSKAVLQALEDILTAIQLLRDEAAAYRYPVKHDIHVISDRIRAFISGHES